MRVSSLCAAAAFAAAAVVAPTTTSPAQAITVTPESNSILVTSQYAGTGCAYNDRVTIANATTGALVQDVGRPATVNGVLNEAKPFDKNRKIVALWGGRSNGNLGGVGVYDRATSTWTTAFSLPSGWERDGMTAHSVTPLPDGYFAVAQVGSINNTGSGYVVVFDSAGVVKDTKQLASAHGVEWDATRDALFAVGWKTVEKYTFSRTTRTLTPVATYTLPMTSTTAPGGHEIRRRRVDSKFFVTTMAKNYVFDPDGTTRFTELFRTDNGASYGTHVKAIDQRFDGKINYSHYQKSTMFFADSADVNLAYCGVVYKAGRWIWNAGQPVFPEDDTAPPPPASAPAEPFLWARDLLTASTATPMGSMIWAGSAAYNDKAGVAKQINDQQAAGKVPYVMFYHFGDDGNPKMDQVATASQTQIDEWVGFATTIAQAIGDGNPAYVVIESEYDAEQINNSSHPMCSSAFQGGFHRVIDEFEKYAGAAVLVNSPGLWRSESTYACMKPIAARLTHGFPLHSVSNDPDCTYRPWNGTYYESGRSTAALAADAIVPDIVSRANKMRTYFGSTSNPADSPVLVTDLAVTRCPGDPDWGDAGQAAVIQRLADNIDNLYADIGLRGVQIRTGGPEKQSNRYMGDQNEYWFTWSSQTTSAVASGKTNMQSYLTTIAGTGTPAFKSTATAPANVAPGGTATIQFTVANEKSSLTNGNVKLEVYNPGGTIQAQQSWTGQSFSNGQSRTYTYSWTAPATTGNYVVKLGVFSSDWNTTHHWNNGAATIAVGTSDPAFTSSASASPSSVGTGATSTITASVTNTGGALSNGQVDVEVYSPEGTVVDSKSWTAQSIASGATATYPFTWTAPLTTGDYGVRVAVGGPGGSPAYHYNGGAGTVSVTANKFTSSATTTRTTVMPGGPAPITATVDNVGSALSNGEVALEMYDSAGVRVAQSVATGQNIAGGASATYNWTWTAPATVGTYTLKVSVTGAGGTPVHHVNGSALTVGVAGARFETSAGATPTLVAPSGTTTVTVTVTNKGGALEDGNVDLEIFNSAGTRVLQTWWSDEYLVNGQTKTYSYNWTVPATTGTYTARVGVMSSSWGTTHHWNSNADQITVTAPTFKAAATVSASTVQPGGSVTIDADFTATGGALVNGITDIEIYNPVGTRVAQSGVTGRNISDGATLRHSYTWNVPTTSPVGTYTVRLGVFSAGWSTTYHWNNAANTISVGGTFQPSFKIGDGANGWWIEVYTSSDVTGVDVIGKDGAFYLPLVKRDWGAWAATAPSELSSTSLVRFVARRSSDGMTAGSNNFYWLAGSPTTDPGWACTFAIGSGASTSNVQVVTSTTATAVEVKVGNGAFTALTQGTPGTWSKAMSVPVGSKVVFRATRADGARAYSQIYNWLQ